MTIPKATSVTVWADRDRNESHVLLQYVTDDLIAGERYKQADVCTVGGYYLLYHGTCQLDRYVEVGTIYTKLSRYDDDEE